MPPSPYILLHNHTALATVRAGLEAADAPAAGLWSPDNLNDGEEGTPEDFILDARDWQTVRLIGDFTGSPGGSETATVVPLMAIRDPAAPGRRWIALAAATLAPHLDHELVVADGHLLAFRVTALTLDGATNLALRVTGGQRLVPSSV